MSYILDEIIFSIKKTERAIGICQISPPYIYFDLKSAMNGKEIETKSGRKAMIIANEGVGDKPLVVMVEDDDGTEIITRYTITGMVNGWPSVDDKKDLRMKFAGVVEYWTNVYKNPYSNEIEFGRTYSSRREAVEKRDCHEDISKLGRNFNYIKTILICERNFK